VPGAELHALSERLVGAFADQSLDRVRHAMGQAGKETFLAAVDRDAGPDRKLSGLRRGRGPTITAGYDLDAVGVWLNMRPKGVILLLSDGRKRTTAIRPRRRKGRNGRPAALRFGGRYVRSSMSRPSRGLNTLDDAVRAMPAAVTKAGSAAMVDTLAKEL
jgi:hypothetical protein